MRKENYSGAVCITAAVRIIREVIAIADCGTEARRKRNAVAAGLVIWELNSQIIGQ